MICARCGKVRGNCVGHEFDTEYGVREVVVPEVPMPKFTPLPAWRVIPGGRGPRIEVTDRPQPGFNCALCKSRHEAGECTRRLSHVVIYGQR